jgi:hypothetical protein
VEASLFKRAYGFEHEVEKATASGKKVKIKEYFPPDVGALRLWLQNRMPEVYREVKEIKSTMGVEEGFLRFLQRLDDKAKMERETGQLPKLIEQQAMPRYDDLSPEELEHIRRFIEETDIDVLQDEEMWALVEKHWPWLLEKLEPKRMQ